MNCEQTIAYIDQYFDEKLDGLSKEVEEHIEQCNGCRQYLDAGKKIALISTKISNESFRLKDPESMTERIMSSIAFHPQQQQSPRNGRLVLIFHNNSLRKLIAAAAMLLFAVFSYEQYLILDKVNRLESQYIQQGEGLHWEISTMKTYRQLRTIQSSIYAGVIQQEREKQTKKPSILRLLLTKNDDGVSKLIQSDITWPGRNPLSVTGQ